MCPLCLANVKTSPSTDATRFFFAWQSLLFSCPHSHLKCMHQSWINFVAFKQLLVLLFTERYQPSKSSSKATSTGLEGLMSWTILQRKKIFLWKVKQEHKFVKWLMAWSKHMHCVTLPIMNKLHYDVVILVWLGKGILFNLFIIPLALIMQKHFLNSVVTK